MADVASLAGELIGTGLATPNPYDHLTLNPALCPHLRGKLNAAQHERSSRSDFQSDQEGLDQEHQEQTHQEETDWKSILQPEALTTRWVEVMRGYVRFLVQQQSQPMRAIAQSIIDASAFL